MLCARDGYAFSHNGYISDDALEGKITPQHHTRPWDGDVSAINVERGRPVLVS